MEDVGWSLLAVLVFAGLAFFFSLHKLAFQMFSRVKLQEALRSANKNGSVDIIGDSQEEFTLICSFYYRISNVFLVLSLVMLLGGSETGSLFESLIVVMVIALAIVVCNLALSFAWAKYAGEKIIIRTLFIIKVICILTKPMLAVFKLNDVLIKRLSGHGESSAEEQQEEKQEEFLNVVEEQMMEGVVDQQEQEMIEHVLELDDTTAGQIMTPRTDVVAIDVNSDFEAVIKTVTAAGHSRIPVYENTVDSIVGLVYAKDMLTMFHQGENEFSLKSKLREAFYVPETKSLRVLLNEFKARKLHMAVVLDEYGGTAGIVTIEDILEELVGEIEDEYETTSPQIINRVDENTVDIDGRTYIDDLNEELDIELPEDEDYDTVGGFVFSHLGSIPKSGKEFEYQNLRFTITQATERNIKRLKIEKLQSKKVSEQ